MVVTINEFVIGRVRSLSNAVQLQVERITSVQNGSGIAKETTAVTNEAV